MKDVEKAARRTRAILKRFPFRLSCVSRPCNLAFAFLKPLQFGIICKYEEDVPILTVNDLRLQQPQQLGKDVTFVNKRHEIQ